MAIEIVMPRLGWTMEEGTLVEWLKKPGEAVQAGEVLFTVETDKAINEVESFDAGRLHIPEDAPGPGATVPVGTVLGYLLAEGEEPPASVAPAAPGPAAGSRAGGAPAASSEGGRRGATPEQAPEAPGHTSAAGSEAPGAEGASAPPQGSGAEAAPPASSEGAGQGAAGTPARPAPAVTPAGAPQEAANAAPASEAAAPRQTPAGREATPGGGTADAQESSATAGAASAPAISPRARRLAQQLGIDWRKVRGTGRTGRITEDDVRAAAADQAASGGSTEP